MLLTQAEAIKQAVNVLTVIYAHDFTSVPAGSVVFTDEVDNALYDVAGYFDPSSDNADVLFDIVEKAVKSQPNKDWRTQTDQVLFYAELILEDFYNTKIKAFGGDSRSMLIVNMPDHSVRNLSPLYLRWSRDTRKIMYALLIGGYYDNFVS